MLVEERAGPISEGGGESGEGECSSRRELGLPTTLSVPLYSFQLTLCAWPNRRVMSCENCHQFSKEKKNKVCSNRKQLRENMDLRVAESN